MTEGERQMFELLIDVSGIGQAALSAPAAFGARDEAAIAGRDVSG